MTDLINTDMLDLEAADAAQLVLLNHNHYRFYLCGAGGNGSYLAPELVRYVKVLREMGCRASVVFIDPDTVEHKNTYRQNFCPAEVGQPKAVALATRLGFAWGMEIPAIVAKFSPDMVSHDAECINVLIGCVDNAEGRAAIHQALSRRYYWSNNQAPTVWHLDCANGFRCGTVRIGAVADAEMLKDAFPAATICHALPAPALVEPELLVHRTEEPEKKDLSCAELLFSGEQSMTINKNVAAIAADYIYQLTISKELNRFATFVDLATGVMNSEYITPKRIAGVINRPVDFVLAAEPDELQGELEVERAA